MLSINFIIVLIFGSEHKNVKKLTEFDILLSYINGCSDNAFS